MSTNTNWQIPYLRQINASSEISAKYNPLLAKVLSLRGIKTVAEAEEFLSVCPTPSLDPFDLPEMAAAVARIRQAIEKHERVVVYGDYDVDGITATCLLSDYLRSAGLNCATYIPKREEEGYGLNKEAIDKFKNDGIKLIITVDCGITAFEECKRAASNNIDVIITDHHEYPNGEAPSACAVVNCKKPSYQLCGKHRFLAGVGVAFMLVCACSGDYRTETEKYCDLVAVGTIADVVTLSSENRALVKLGITKLMRNPRPGFLALMTEAGVQPDKLTATTVGFILAPRLNAAGRLAEARLALDLLSSESDAAATALAKKLCELNAKRQSIEKQIYDEAQAILSVSPPDGPIVLSDERWEQGVIGIAASRLAEQYSLPAIMICFNGDMGKGSCRSYGGFNLYDALSACSSDLESFGGHALAAGLNIRRDKVDSFRAALKDYYFAHKPEDTPFVKCDILLPDAGILEYDNVESLNLLEPFGSNNAKPVFCLAAADVLPSDVKSIGNDRHVKFKVLHNDKLLECIWFGHSKDEVLSCGSSIDVAFFPQTNDFKGKKSVQLLVAAVRQHDVSAFLKAFIDNRHAALWSVTDHIPDRTAFAFVWRNLKNAGDRTPATVEQFLSSIPAGITAEKYCICLSAFLDCGLLESGSGSILGASTKVLDGKADLEATNTMLTLRDIQ